MDGYLRLLLHYFPTRLPELTTSTSRALMLRLYYVRLSVSFIVFALGLWQVRSLKSLTVSSPMKKSLSLSFFCPVLFNVVHRCPDFWESV